MENNVLEQSTPEFKLLDSTQASVENRIVWLEAKIADLKFICDNLNPYGEIDSTLKDRLNTHQIYDFYDPFTITNKLLVSLEDSIEELHRLKDIPLD
ncbi:MAG: hypothetical protein KAG61_02390 [Bacteriovoracaceae bacterium]|nr:hypothetical protein [Bacteriovoracaceae bacterium]